MSEQNAATKVVIGPVRFSYLHVWEPTAMQEDQKKKYSGSFLIPKSDKKTIAAVKAAIEAAKEQGKGKWGGKIPAKLEISFYDGDVEKSDKEEYADCYYINAKSDARPGIVDKNRQPIVNQEDVYSGAYGYVSIVFYPYDFNGKKGIAAALNNIMKTKDGEKFGGVASADEDFATIAIEEDDII